MVRKNNTSRSGRFKNLISAVFLFLVVIVVVGQRRTFAVSLSTIGQISLWWVFAGFGMLLLSVLASSMVYLMISPRPLNFWRTAAVQAGGLGLNRVLPAGSGALGVSYLYLVANRVSKLAAAAVVALNNLLGFAGHALLLGLAIAIDPSVFDQFPGLSAGRFGQWIGFGAGILLLLALLLLILQGKHTRTFATIKPVFARPGRIAIALLFSMLLTLCYVSAILLSAAAVGFHLSLAAGIIVLSFGVVAASAIPVPGGIGAAEAGVYAAMRAYGASSEDALAVALLYRLMTFWLPLLFGGVMFGLDIKWNLLKSQSIKSL